MTEGHLGDWPQSGRNRKRGDHAVFIAPAAELSGHSHGAHAIKAAGNKFLDLKSNVAHASFVSVKVPTLSASFTHPAGEQCGDGDAVNIFKIFREGFPVRIGLAAESGFRLKANMARACGKIRDVLKSSRHPARETPATKTLLRHRAISMEFFDSRDFRRNAVALPVLVVIPPTIRPAA